MTRYEIPSEPASNSSVTPNVENSTSRIDPTDLESRMARLVGLEEEPQLFHEDSAAFTEEPISTPQDVQTEQSLSSNPFAKVGLVGAGTLALVLVAGAVLSQIMSGGNNKPRNIVKPQVRSQPTNEPRLQQQGTEIETLKTKLALAQQANDVKAAQEQLRNEKPILRQQPGVQKPASRPTVLVQRVPTPTRPYTPPRILRVERIVRVPQPAAQRTPTPQQQLPIVPPTIEPSVQPTPIPTPDPLQEWSRLAKLGSYGQAPASDKQSLSTTAITQPAITQRPPLNIQPSRSPTPVIPAPSPVTQQQNSKSTVIGSSAKAKLVTAVYGETTQDNPYNRGNRNNSNNNSNNNNDVFVAQLTEPLKAADGSVVLPKDTQLLFNVASTSDKGLMQLNVFKVTWKDKGNRIEKTVPLGALVLRGSGGPALAQQVQPKQTSHFSSDVKTFLLGGAGQIGQELNRPNQQYVNNCYNNNTSTSSNNSNNNCIITTYPRDIGASVLEGGGKAISPEISRRNQQTAPPRTSERNNVFVIPAGKEVQVFVNQPTQL